MHVLGCDLAFMNQLDTRQRVILADLYADQNQTRDDSQVSQYLKPVTKL